jgi:hypothetical protein
VKRDQFLIDSTDISRAVKYENTSVNLSCQVQDVALRIGVAYLRFVSPSSDFFRHAFAAEQGKVIDLRHWHPPRALLLRWVCEGES